ncbi:MAG: hypothetical protein E6J91_06480 [Deltaproteobacteria bacterium]|nr:MAG: hypothetical protein E6J91_06480 [Deltaproteobacteria bacterium]
MRHSKFDVLGAVAMVAVAAASAHAQSEAAQAETLFRHGKDLMARGQIAEACAAFDASEKLEPTIATLLNQASCRATAWGLFLDAARQTRAATDDAGRQMHRSASERAARIEPRLSTLTITVLPENRVGGLEILRDGEVIEPGAWNRALPIDGATYRITARAPGNAAWSSTVTIAAERDARTIETPRLKAAEIGEPPPPAPGARPAPVARVRKAAEPRRSRVVPLVLGGATIALAGTAVGLELWSRTVYDRAKREPDDARQEALWHSANARRYAAEGLAVAGVGCAGVAVWWMLRGPERAPAQPDGLTIAPVIGDGRLGWVVEGRF